MQQPVTVTSGGVRWLVSADCQGRLLGPAGLRLDEWLREGQAQVVKHGPHRTVYRVTLPGLAFYLKHYRLMDLRAWLRELVRPAKALMEYRRTIAVAACAVPTVVPLAVGRTCRSKGPADSFLITQSLDDAEPLNAFVEKILPTLAPDEARQIRQTLAQELGRFVARLHDEGIVHNDLHAGNVLVRHEGSSVRLFLIDLHAVNVGRPLGWRQRLANLVIFNHYFILRSNRSDRLRFWRAYAAATDAVNACDPELPRLVERRTETSNLVFWSHRDRRCRESNRYFQKVRSEGFMGYAVRDLDAAVLSEIVRDPDEPFRDPGAVVLKDSRSSTVAEVERTINGVRRRLIYKRFRVTSWTDPFTALVRPTGAIRSWIAGHALGERRLPTPRPLVVLHRRSHGLAGDAYLLMEKVDEAVALDRFVHGLKDLPAGRSVLQSYIEEVARLLRLLHRRGLSHRDLKASNILVAPTGVSLIDLVGIRRHGNLGFPRKVQNLARLHVSFCKNPFITRADKLRFLRVYMQWGLVGKSGWKHWWRAIAQATAAKIARNLQSGRPLG